MLVQRGKPIGTVATQHLIKRTCFQPACQAPSLLEGLIFRQNVFLTVCVVQNILKWSCRGSQQEEHTRDREEVWTEVAQDPKKKTKQKQKPLSNHRDKPKARQQETGATLRKRR